jgi:isoquinoline 1-oxidoreductase beta subunit
VKLTRRKVLVAAAAVGGGLAVGLAAVVGGGTVALSRHDRRAHQQADLPRDLDGDLVSLWVQLQPDGHVVVHSPHTEMGQGAHHGLRLIVAEELVLPLEHVTVRQAPARTGFSNGNVIQGFVMGDRKLEGFFQRVVENAFFLGGDLAHMQLTGGSTSIRFTGWRSIRVAAAAARQMLVAAAAAQLDADVTELVTADGQVRHPPTDRALGYGELAPLAAQLPVPADPVMRPRSEWRLVGTSPPRADLPGKIFGGAIYGIDRHLPGLRYAAVRGARQIGGTIASIDNRDEVAAMRGVLAIVPVQEGVAVVADNPWRAQQAADALQLSEPDGPHADEDTASLEAAMWAALDEPDRLTVLEEHGSIDSAQGTEVRAEYFVPFLAHAPMEPMNATVWEDDGRVHVAAGVQNPLMARTFVVDHLQLADDDVVFHAHTMGGGFGRRASGGDDMHNYLRQLLVAWKAVGRVPLKLIWSREVDMRQDRYRKQAVARYRGTVGDDGRASSWQADSFAEVMIPDDVGTAYAVPHFLQRTVHEATFVPYAYWRSVEASIHCFFNESFADEMARAAGADPLAWRIEHLPAGHRLIGVLQAVRDASGWSATPADDGSAMGVAAYDLFGSYCAQVARVSLRDGQPVVHDMWCAIDCGTVVNPDGVVAQMQGGMIFGLTAALYGRIDIEGGGVKQSNFHDYRMVTLRDAPRLHVTLVDSDEAPGGVGEVAVPHPMASVANALATLGQRPRRLPIVG